MINQQLLLSHTQFPVTAMTWRHLMARYEILICYQGLPTTEKKRRQVVTRNSWNSTRLNHTCSATSLPSIAAWWMAVCPAALRKSKCAPASTKVSIIGLGSDKLADKVIGASIKTHIFIKQLWHNLQVTDLTLTFSLGWKVSTSRVDFT